MSSKDLNLSLDSSLVQPQIQPEPSTHSTQSSSARKISQTALGEERKNPTVQTWLTITIATGIVLLNIAFLIWAGLWLNEQGTNQPASTSTLNGTALSASIKSATTPELRKIEEQLLALHAQVDQLNLRIADQQQILSANLTDIARQLKQQQLETSTKAISPALSPAKPKPEANWYVNLGTFSSKAAAEKLQQRIKALEYSAVITTATINNRAAYRVQLPGFLDRDSAENTAQKLMQQTKLNGLWAWKDE